MVECIRKVASLRQWILAGIAPIVFLALAVVVLSLILLLRDPSDSCQPSPNKGVQLSDWQRIPSSGGKHLIGVLGHVELVEFGDRKWQIPLELQEVIDSSDEQLDESRMSDLTLNFGCCSLAAKIDISGQLSLITGFKLELGRLADVPARWTSCELPRSFALFPRDQRLSCQGRVALLCQREQSEPGGRKYNETVAEIVFDALEIELEGDPERAKVRQFSKPAAEGGCQLIVQVL